MAPLTMALLTMALTTMGLLTMGLLTTTYYERARSYLELRNAAPLEVVVLGGGPIGMRAAVEMALLGHKVYLLWYTCYGYTYYGAAEAQGILTMAVLTMALLGHKVTVLESRDRCSRLNVLKLCKYSHSKYGGRRPVQ
eukprot:scaffold65211_cov58-Phaeocystis_antarctica.AAC.2